MCLQAKSKDQWYLDSGCSRHMTGDKTQFTFLKPKDGGLVTFGDNGKGKIEGIGVIGKNSLTSIEHVLFVQGLKHNLLSISQLCDKGYRVIFESSHCLVVDINNNKTKFIGTRQGNVYKVDLNDLVSQNIKCLVSMNEDNGWLWHRRLAHASMDLISKLSRNELVVGLPKIKFVKDKLYDAY